MHLFVSTVAPLRVCTRRCPTASVLPDTVCHSCWGEEVCKGTQSSPRFVFKTNVNCSQNWTSFSPLKIKTFFFWI
ncbi:protein tyrosine phosphatase 4a2, isoform CRA_b [Rattus norvegicus]|uniref:Protein tyrosine phosphatase 4a2, isoform CRA_b n=1 Tax=Rattus norvegicus TaxID=10116 RepID=A6ISM3_RAT|nr:protein tyrosine phosphatase 4a2, isoform CRA_b [Rattus norvegicus]